MLIGICALAQRDKEGEEPDLVSRYQVNIQGSYLSIGVPMTDLEPFYRHSTHSGLLAIQQFVLVLRLG